MEMEENKSLQIRIQFNSIQFFILLHKLNKLKVFKLQISNIIKIYFIK